MHWIFMYRLLTYIGIRAVGLQPSYTSPHETVSRAKPLFFGQKPAANVKKKHFSVFLKRKNGIHPVQWDELKEVWFFTNKYWVGWVGQSNYEWKYCRQCKQFQFTDSMLFGQVRLAVFWELSVFCRQTAQPPTKNWPIPGIPMLTDSWQEFNTNWQPVTTFRGRLLLR